MAPSGSKEHAGTTLARQNSGNCVYRQPGARRPIQQCGRTALRRILAGVGRKPRQHGRGLRNSAFAAQNNDAPTMARCRTTGLQYRWLVGVRQGTGRPIFADLLTLGPPFTPGLWLFMPVYFISKYLFYWSYENLHSFFRVIGQISSSPTDFCQSLPGDSDQAEGGQVTARTMRFVTPSIYDSHNPHAQRCGRINRRGESPDQEGFRRCAAADGTSVWEQSSPLNRSGRDKRLARA